MSNSIKAKVNTSGKVKAYQKPRETEMAATKAKVNSLSTMKATIQGKRGFNAKSYVSVSNDQLENIINIGDVDSSTLGDGSVLVYNESTEKWLTTNSLEKQDIDAGEF